MAFIDGVLAGKGVKGPLTASRLISEFRQTTLLNCLHATGAVWLVFDFLEKVMPVCIRTNTGGETRPASSAPYSSFSVRQKNRSGNAHAYRLLYKA
jgi:hypothetical protein